MLNVGLKDVTDRFLDNQCKGKSKASPALILTHYYQNLCCEVMGSIKALLLLHLEAKVLTGIIPIFFNHLSTIKEISKPEYIY